jgi:hypothetical protein
MSKLLALVTAVALAVLLASAAPAGSPMMSTSPAFPAGTCGAPEDVCIPSLDVFANPPGLPPATAPLLLPGFFGLVPGDDVTGLSWGLDSFTGLEPILFSVDPGSAGAAGTSVALEAATADHPGDVFIGGILAGPLPNALVLDGNALPGGGPPATGLTEPFLDDTDALSTCDPAAALLTGILPFITLGPGSPTALGLGFGPGDILLAPPGGPPGPFVPAGAMGLAVGPVGCAPPVCDAIDALAVDAGATVAVFSLAPGSPTLPLLGIGPQDLLITAAGFGPAAPFFPGGLFGLAPGDNLDALDLGLDADGDLVNDACDNCAGTPNNDQLDSNADGIGDACTVATTTTTTSSSTTTTTVAGTVGVDARKLIIVDKFAFASVAKAVFVAKDLTPGRIQKGVGTALGAISVSFDVDYVNAATGGSFSLPPGAFGGIDGWVVNKPTVAKYVNKAAPGGPTEAKVGVVKPDKLLKLVARGLGSPAIDIIGAGAPGPAGVVTDFEVTNGAFNRRHCSLFTSCVHKPVAAGAGAKLVCKPGVPAVCP